MSKFIFGIHDYSPAWIQLVLEARKDAWCLDTEAIGHDDNDFGSKQYDDHGGRITHIVRLNAGYGSAGTIPLPQHYGDFARRCANFAKGTNAKWFVIGNEINMLWDAPEGQAITLDNYIACYNLCYDAIKAVRPDAMISPQAHGTWNPDTRYADNPSGDWCTVVKHQIERVKGADWIALHAYAHRHDPACITAGDKMGAPFDHRHYHFKVYEDQMKSIPARFKHLPVIITEANGDEVWKDENNGFLQAMYGEIDWWNNQADNQVIRGCCVYRWPCGLDGIDRGMECKGGVVDDFKQSLHHDYRWPDRTFKTGGMNMSIGNAIGNAATSEKFKAGDLVAVKVAARMRNAPNASGEIVINLSPGVQLQITGEAQQGNGLTWWPVLGANMTGFVAEAAPDGTVILERYLRLHRPCDGPETQQFGERPEYYSQIQGYAVPLKGHNGLDYGLVIGSDVRAADDGYIYDIRNEDEGFGLHVLIQHTWGATLYAHLSQMLVNKGDPVTRGQVFAKSGDSGKGSGPHLHFGLKVYPNDKADGWGGYCDPKLHLEDLED